MIRYLKCCQELRSNFKVSAYIIRYQCPEIGRQYRTNNMAAIALQWKSNVKLIAASSPMIIRRASENAPPVGAHALMLHLRTYVTLMIQRNR